MFAIIKNYLICAAIVLIAAMVLVTVTVPAGICEDPAISDVFQPGSGAAWAAGTTNLIAWHSANVSGNVSIDLLKGGTVISNLTKNVSAVTGSTGDLGVWGWDVPDNLGAGSDYQIKVSSVSSPSASATSGMFSIVGPAISDVSGPASGSNWTVGAISTIVWHPVNLVGTVRIDLLKGGTLVRNLGDGIAILSGDDYGTWNCAMPSDMVTDSDYQVRVTSDSVPACTATSGYFNVDGAAITDVSQPASGAMLSSGTQIPIMWHYTHLTGTARIDLLKDGSVIRNLATGANMTGQTPGLGVWNWNVPYDLTPGTGYMVRVTSELIPACTATGGNFGFVAPRITVSRPINGSTVDNGNTLLVTWDFSNLPMSDSVKIELWQDGSLIRTLTPGVAITIVTPGSGEWNWHLAGNITPGDDYKIRVISVTAPTCYGESGQFSVNGSMATPVPTPTPVPVNTATPTPAPAVMATPTAVPSATPGASATAAAKPSGSEWVALTAAGILATAYLFRKK